MPSTRTEPKTMRVVAAHPDDESIHVIDYQRPDLDRPTAVVLRMLDVGVCGTDAEICAFDYGEPPPGEDFLIPGHESLGIVVETGAGVTGLAPGDLVVPSVRRPCARADCPACRAGRQDFCLTGEYTERGIKGAHGYLAEYVVEEERYLTPVPASLRDVAVLTEPLTIAEKGFEQFTDVQRRLPWNEGVDDAALLRGRQAVVIGAGAVGLLGAMLLLTRGLEVTVYSRSKKPNDPARLIEAMGAAYVSSESVPFAKLAKQLGGIDLVYEAAGASQVAFEVLEHLGTNGVFIFTGVPGRKSKIKIAGDVIMKNLVLQNQAVIGTVNAAAGDFRRAVDDLGRFVAQWPDETRRIIAARHPMDEFCKWVGAKDGIKHVIAVSEE